MQFCLIYILDLYSACIFKLIIISNYGEYGKFIKKHHALNLNNNKSERCKQAPQKTKILNNCFK